MELLYIEVEDHEDPEMDGFDVLWRAMTMYSNHTRGQEINQ